MAEPAPVLDVRNLSKSFPAGKRGRSVHAVRDVTFSIGPGQTLGMVGESGSGKTTIGRIVTRLIEPTSGSLHFMGRDITHLDTRQLRDLRSEIQIVFQDPWSALNPRLKVRTLIEEPFRIHRLCARGEIRERAAALAAKVQLEASMLDRYPNELSGGQLQRVCIARALATNPRLLVLDEPTSALDLSVRAGMISLLKDLREETGVAMLFISHDLSTVRMISDRVVVLYLGAVVECGDSAAVFERRAHPYTEALLSAHLPANPLAELRPIHLEGDPPSPIDVPPGCVFSNRCWRVVPECRAARPDLRVLSGGLSEAACIRAGEGENRFGPVAAVKSK